MGPTGRLVTIKRSGLDGPHFPLSLSTCLFGRGIECDIRIQLPVVSKQHCKIEVNDQKAVLFNFSATNPTQVNGSAIDGPVQLKHGDVITVIDRSFRYENDSHQNRSKSTEFPGQRREQASPSRVSRSSFPSNPDGKVQDPSAARSQVTEEGGSGGPPERRERVGATRTPSRGSEGPTTKGTADVGSSEPPGDNQGNAAGPLAGGFGAGSCVTAGSWNGGQGLEKDGENESPFRKLYESMKEELDVKSETVLQNRRKSGARGHRASEAESAGGSQSETQPRVSPKSRRRSGRSSQTEAERAGEGPGQTLEATASPSIPPTEMTEAKTPVQCPQPSSSRRRRSGDLSVTPGGEPVSLQQSEDLGAGSAASAPRRLSARQQTPANGESAGHLGNTAEKVFSRKRRRSLSPSVGILTTGADIPKQTLLSPLLVPAERKVPGLSAVDVSNVGDSLNKTEGKPLKRRRVSFGGHLRPELFDENLPPNTPLKRGETPMTRRSLVTHTPPVLKKIIKEQPPPSEKGGSSEIRLEVTTQNMFTSSPVHSPPKTSPLANHGRRRSLKSPASSGNKSPHQTDAPQRGGRRSSSGPARRASVDRSQHGILQTIHSRRRSGASEANLMVARSWADVVKLCAKQTQTKVVRHGPPRPPSKRQRRMNTPKKPLGSVHNEFSTGHAASPCTIVIGKAHIEKVTVPARPYRMLNNFVINKKIDFNEDLSGLTEMFKTPAKEKPQTMTIGPTTFSNSEDSLGKKFQALNSEENVLLCTPGKFGENVYLRAQNAPEEPWDKQSSSPALTQQYVTVNGNMKTPRSETEPPKAAASSTNKSRRSVELRNIEVTSTECEKDDKEVDTVQNILGRCLKKSSVQAQLPAGEMKERERSFETCKKNIEPKENSEKLITVRRSRRSSELKCTPRAGLIPIQRLQETESKEDLEGIHSFLQNPSHAEEPVDTEAKTILMHCKSPPPVSTPTKVNTRIKTPSQRVNVEDLSDLRKPTQTPGDTTDTQKEPAGGEKSMKEFKEAPEQKLDSSENVTRSRRRSRTPKRKVQPIEDLAGFKELFQTPNHIAETVIDDKTPCKSPKPEPVSTPISTKRRFRTPLGKVDVEEELSSLRKPTPGETTHSHREPEGDDKSTELFKETPKQDLDSAENVTGSRRRSKTPKRKVQPMEDLVGFKELFQTPIHIAETVTDDKTTKTPCRSPKSEPVSTPTSTKRRSRTPLGKVDVVDELSSLRKPTPRPRETTHSHREPEGDDKGIKAFKETPKQKLDSAENIIGSRRSRTPKRKVQPIEDLVGFKELFQTPIHIAETVTDDKTTKTPCRSPKSEPVSTPTSTKRRSRTPLGKVDVVDELSSLRKPTPRPGETTHSHREPEGDDKGIKAFKETPEQKLDSAENVIGSRRRSRTPKRKVQPIEDLASFKEFFQTPIHIAETVTDDKITKTPCKSPKSKPVITPTSSKRCFRTPLGKVDLEEALSALRKPTPRPGEATHSHKEPEGDVKSAELFKGTPKQELDSAENVIGSRRRSKTPKRKVQPIEDLVGFEELFQTPIHIAETVTDDKITKTPCKSPKSEPVSTPTSTKRRSRTPLGKVDVEEELSSLRKPTPRPGETTQSHREPEGEDKDIKAFKETPKQKPNSAENVTGSRRRSRTPMRKVQPIEDLAGFKELFQTPIHITERVTDDKTKTPCKSPKPEPVITSISMTRRLSTPLGKMDVEEELSALRKPTSGETTHSHKEPEGDDKGIKAFKETPEQKLDSAKYATGSRRRSRTPRRKVQPIEDLTGFKELFQTPDQIIGTVTDDKVTKTPCKSPKPEPVITPASSKRCFRTPLGKVDVQEALSSLRKPTPRPGEATHSHKEPEGDVKSAELFKGTPKQELDSAENVTGSRRRSKTPKRKVQPIEDLVGFKELFQTPIHIAETVTDDKIAKTPCKSPKSEPVSTPTSTKRRSRTPLGKVDVEEELSSLRKPTPRPRETTHSHREPEGDDKGITAFKETPKQKPDSPENVTGSRRRSRTPKRKVQPIEDLAGFKELFQTPDHTVEPMTDDKTTKISCQSPQPEPVITSTSMMRPLRTPLGKVDVEEELSALRKPTPGETTHSHREPEGDDKGITAFKETPEQKPDSGENVTGSRRRSRTPKRRVQPIEDLVGFKELFQTPDHIMESLTDDKTTKIPCKSQDPEPVIMLTGRNRRVKAPQRKVVVGDEVSALRRPTRAPGKTTRSHRAPEVADKDTKVFMEIPEEKSDPAENVTGSKRRPRTRKEKAQLLEDLAGLKDEPETVAKTTEMPSKSPQPEAVMPARRKRQVKAPPGKVDMEEELSAPRKPTQTSAKTTRSHRAPEVADKDIKLLKEIPEEKSDPAENVTGSKRRLRTRKEKAQPLEDLAGLKDEPETVAKTTEMPSKLPQPEAVMPARRKRQVKAPPGKVDMEEELSAPRKPTRTSAKTTRSHRAPEVADKDIKLLKEIPEEKSDPAENVTGSKRRLRTRKEKAQPLEDLAGLKEPFQIPSHTEEPETVVKTTEMPSRSPQPEAVMPARRKRQVKAPPGKVDVEEELSAPRKPTRTSAKTTRSHRPPEVPDKDIKLLKEIPEEKSDPAENVTGSKRRPRARKEKAQPLEDLAGLKDEPETVVKTTEMPSKSPQPEAVMPARRKRQVKAPPRKVDVEEELSAPRTSGKTTRSHREPVDIKVFKESPRQKLGPAENTEGSKRQLRSRKGKAQPPESPARCQQSLQSSIQDEELGIGAESVRTPTQAPGQSKPAKPRRVLWALDVKPVEDQVGSRDPVKSQRGSSVSLPPKRKREDGSPTRMRRLRTSTRAQDPAEEKPPPKRQRAAPQERCEPPEPLGVKKRQGALAESTEDVPSEDMKTKNRGRRAPGATSPGKEMSLRSRLPNKASSAEQTPESLLTADKVKTKRSGKKPVTASPEAESQPPEDGARSSASGDTVHERRTHLRPGRRGKAPSPSAAGETSVETHGKTQEERGAQRAGSTRVRSRKVTVPPTGDTSESQPKPRVTRSAKRPAEKSQQENDDAGVKKIRTRSRRGRDDV